MLVRCRETFRSSLFNANVEKITAHNMKGESWTMAVNEFADLSSEEFLAARTGYISPARKAQLLTAPANDNFERCVPRWS